jgi:hypothetical protein
LPTREPPCTTPPRSTLTGGNAWPTDTSDVTNADHEFSPVLQAPVANLLGEPWYLESGSPGGDYVTWLNLDGGG